MLEHISKPANKVLAELTKWVLIKKIEQLDLKGWGEKELLELKDSIERSINETSRKSFTNGNS